MVCGDDPDTVEILLRLMDAAGFELTRASSHADALAALDATPGVVLLLTQTHPGDGAVELASRVRAHDEIAVRGVPIVAVIGQGIDDTPLLDAQLQAVLRKPVRSEIIVETIRRLCGS